MKKLIGILFTAMLTLTNSAFAHGDGHGEETAGISISKAIDLAQTSAKMLTFKDHGMSVGKIDESWNKVSEQQFTLKEQTNSQYIIAGYNQKLEQTLYFTVTKSGQVKAVEKAKAFKKNHGHAH